MSVPKYFLEGNSHAQLVFDGENQKLYSYSFNEYRKNGDKHFCCKDKHKACPATVTEGTNGDYRLSSSKHSCKGSTESQILVKLAKQELNNKV